MEIRFMVNGFSPDENIYANTRDIFSQAMAEVGCPADAITELIVADGENFGAAIQILAQGVAHTDNENYVAVGKTLSLPVLAGPSVSGVVIRDFILGSAFTALGKQPHERSAEEQRSIYVIWHEVAHALDARKRPASSHVQRLTDPQGLFKLRHIASFFAPIVLEEVVVSYLSACACGQSMLLLERQSDDAVIHNQLVALRQETMEFIGSAEHLRKIAFMAAQVFWIPFVQYGKAIAHALGNPHISEPAHLWQNAVPGTNDVMNEFRTIIQRTISAYPDGIPDLQGPLFELWKKLALIHGYDFRESIGGDGIYW